MALFLKYRPQTFADLVGQQAVRRTLQNALKAEKPAHAYLFAGSRGTGKTSTARIFAKGLNCENLQDGNPCDECRFCTQTTEGSLVDVIEIDAASNRGIDEIRDLREKINFAPNVAKRKVYIIDEVHMLTKEAFNALLKTLEEPPDHAFFCLATTEIHKIPETILSRCQVFLFQRFSLEQLIDRLQFISDEESFKTEPDALNLIARKAEGGMRDAVSLLEQLAAELDNHITATGAQQSLGLSSVETLENLFKAIETDDTEAGMTLIKGVAQNGQDFRSFGHEFLGYLREAMFTHLKDEKLPLILQTINEFEKALSRLKTTPIMELPFEMAVINLTTDQLSNRATEQPKKVIEEVKAEPVPKPEPKVKPDVSGDSPSEALAKPEVTPKPESPTDNNDLTPQAVTKQMSQIVEKSGIPIFAKKSFLTTIPEIQGTRIIFYTDSEFHREKLNDSGIHAKILGACKDIFQQSELSVDFVKKAGSAQATATAKASADDFLTF